MKFFLTIKHWQLFLLAWGLPLVLDFIFIFNPQSAIIWFPLMMLVFAFSIFGWIYSIAVELHPKLPTGVSINLNVFKIAFAIPLIYLTIMGIGMGLMLFHWVDESTELIEMFLPFVLFAHVLSMVCIFVFLRYAAKIMRSVELQREAEAGDYIGEFLLMWLQFVGVWFLQPRLNKLLENQFSQNTH